MQGLKSFRLRNFRSISDTGEIQIKPLTVLVGKNSAGKSSLLRYFPLLKQSFDENTSEALLWYGRRVDFGSFKETIKRGNDVKALSFEFSVTLSRNPLSQTLRSKLLLFRNFPSLIDTTVVIDLRKAENENSEVERLEIKIFDCRCEIFYGANNAIRQIKVNDQVFLIDQQNQTTDFSGILPETHFFRTVNSHQTEYSPIFDTFYVKVKKYLHQRTEPFTIYDIIRKFSVVSLSDFRKSISNASTLQSWRERTPSLITDDETLILWRSELIASMLQGIISEINREIGRAISRTSYIAPIRASAERYYRKQSLRIDEVDSKGENLAQYLYSLDPRDLDKFRQWMASVFDFTVYPSPSLGHIALEISEGGRDNVNMADAGFGFSQLLPIITMLWSTQLVRPNSQRQSSVQNNIVCIEQPELHLHPGYQSKLADVFVNYVASDDTNNKLFIETHSSVLINRIGERVSNGDIDPSCVQILILENVDGTTEIKKTEFDSDGVIEEWPYGFFEANNAY